MGEGKKRQTLLEAVLLHLLISYWRRVREDVRDLSL